MEWDFNAGNLLREFAMIESGWFQCRGGGGRCLAELTFPDLLNVKLSPESTNIFSDTRAGFFSKSWIRLQTMGCVVAS